MTQLQSAGASSSGEPSAAHHKTAPGSKRAAEVTQKAVDSFAADVDILTSNITGVVVADESMVKMTLLGLFARGHVLLEDLPGVGKTLLAKTIAQSVRCGFKRIQFTPDLLPSDITGTSVFDMKETRFDFLPGPIFSNIVLADEINRTGPRTQSALLEAMAEYQVTVEGEARALPSPFMVIATQNMAESHGAFPLPESQLDRFLVSLGMGMPGPEAESLILERSQGGMPAAAEVLTGERVIEMQGVAAAIEVSAPVRQYMVNVIQATRIADGVQFGVSPRGGAALQRAAQCWAAFSGRTHVEPGDVKAVAPYVLPHRILLSASAALNAGQVVSGVLGRVAVPA